MTFSIMGFYPGIMLLTKLLDCSKSGGKKKDHLMSILVLTFNKMVGKCQSTSRHQLKKFRLITLTKGQAARRKETIMVSLWTNISNFPDKMWLLRIVK